MSFYVDVHTHLTHEKFSEDFEDVVKRSEQLGLGSIVVNGLEPLSNRKILEWSKRYPILKPALGIYPLDAVNHLIPTDFPFEVSKFDVDAELLFIRQKAAAGEVFAIGECGLDQYYLGEEFLKPQEKVFEQLIEIALEFDLPLIIHTRKAEVRSGEILAAHGVKRVDFHCFGGRTALAQKYAEQFGWYFSIPSNCTVNEAFQKMLKNLPSDRILTETDAPYLPPVKGQRNEPSTVIGTIEMLAKLRGVSVDVARDLVYNNYQGLFLKEDSSRCSSHDGPGTVSS